MGSKPPLSKKLGDVVAEDEEEEECSILAPRFANSRGGLFAPIDGIGGIAVDALLLVVVVRWWWSTWWWWLYKSSETEAAPHGANDVYK